MLAKLKRLAAALAQPRRAAAVTYHAVSYLTTATLIIAIGPDNWVATALAILSQAVMGMTAAKATAWVTDAEASSAYQRGILDLTQAYVRGVAGEQARAAEASGPLFTVRPPNAPRLH